LSMLSQIQRLSQPYASCPTHTAPPMLLREAPVTEAKTLLSSLHRNTPIKAIIKASLY
jgi:hypothetical protein